MLFELRDGEVQLPVQFDSSAGEVWLTRKHLVKLYGRDVKTGTRKTAGVWNSSGRWRASWRAFPKVWKRARCSILCSTTPWRWIYWMTTTTSALFGVEKDDSFKGAIGNIYQSFGGQDVYPGLQEKAANLLYFVVKNHSFLDGNKRIAATMFLYFLDRNGALFANGEKRIDDSTLVAVTIMIVESKPEEKEAMVALVMNFLAHER